MKANDIFDLLKDAVTIVSVIVDAMTTGDTKKVEDVLPKTARTTIAKAAADARAQHKFG